MNLNNKYDLVIVTPAYEDVDSAKLLMLDLFKNLGGNIFIVIVDDCSLLSEIKQDIIEDVNLNGVVIKLNRNMGHQKAIAVGLNFVLEYLPNAEKIIVMDSDGEDMPESIKTMINVFSSTHNEIVVAKRNKRVESLSFRLFYIFYKFIFKLLTGRSISFGNFMLLSPRALRIVVSMPEIWIHIAGCVLSSKLKLTYCQIDRGFRYAGKSKMSFIGLVLHGFKALMIFSEDVLVRVGIACAFIALLSVFASAIAITLKIMNFATPGWFSVALGILTLVFLQTGTITLISLMLNGVLKNSISNKIIYKDYIDSITYAK